jgi:hypothetical protein
MSETVLLTTQSAAGDGSMWMGKASEYHWSQEEKLVSRRMFFNNVSQTFYTSLEIEILADVFPTFLSHFSS